MEHHSITPSLRNIYTRFSSNSEANASELVENHEEMLPLC